MGEVDTARDELTTALECARERRSDYEIAATIDSLAALESADDEMLSERDEILAALKIVRLPKMAVQVSGERAVAARD